VGAGFLFPLRYDVISFDHATPETVSDVSSSFSLMNLKKIADPKPRNPVIKETGFLDWVLNLSDYCQHHHNSDLTPLLVAASFKTKPKGFKLKTC
jgi:hypothetical protein